MHFAASSSPQQQPRCIALSSRYQFAEASRQTLRPTSRSLRNVQRYAIRHIRQRSSRGCPHTGWRALVDQIEEHQGRIGQLEPLKDDVRSSSTNSSRQRDNRGVANCARGRGRSREDADDLFCDDENSSSRYSTRGEGCPGDRPTASKGLSSPYVLIAQCIQGVFHDAEDRHAEGGMADAARKEKRGVCFRRDHARQGRHRTPRRPVCFYAKEEMYAGTAKQLDVPFTKETLRTGAAHAEHVHRGTRSDSAGSDQRGRCDMKIVVLTQRRRTGYYAATLMKRGHEVTMSGGRAIRARLEAFPSMRRWPAARE